MIVEEVAVEKVARISQATIWLLLGAVSCAAISAGFHSQVHPLSRFFFVCASCLGILAFLKLFNSIAPSLPRPLARLIHWIHAMTFEVFSLAFVFLLHLGAPWRKVAPAGNLKGRPLLLVHGYCNDGGVWIYQKNRLAKENLGPIYTVDLGHPFRSMREYVKKVAEKAAEISKETGRKDLVLIGHSMGGLVSALYALEPSSSVSEIITIASPLNGTHVARIGIGPNAREMQRNSDLVVSLNKKIAADHPPRFYHMGTETDQLVLPTASSLVGNDPNRQFVFQDIGHTALLFSPRVAAKLIQWLKLGSGK